jgi:hypothetical protein
VIITADVVDVTYGPGSIRPTARDPTWLSPILTLAGVTVQLTDTQAYDYAKAEFMLRVELASQTFDAPAIRAFMDPSSGELTDTAETALYDLQSPGQFVVLEPLNFFIESFYVKPLIFRFEVLAVDRGKTTRIMRGVITPTADEEVHNPTMTVIGTGQWRPRGVSAGRTVPVVTAKTLAPALIFDAQLGDPQFAKLAPYVVADALVVKNLDELDFDRLADVITTADDLGLEMWTEFAFVPGPGFFTDFTTKILANLVIGAPVAKQLFAILRRCIAFEPAQLLELMGFLRKACAIEDPKCHTAYVIATAEMLLRVPQIDRTRTSSRLFQFPFQLSASDRALVFSRICGDVDFVNELAMTKVT